jgi:hypothetical protein
MVMISDNQAVGPNNMRNRGYVPNDPTDPLDDKQHGWMEGPLNDRPLSAQPSTVYVTTDGQGAWLWFMPFPFAVGTIQQRQHRAKQGTVYFATDLNKAYMWVN